MNIKRNIKVALRRCPITKGPFGRWERMRIEQFALKKNQELQKHGYQLIFEVQAALEESNNLFFFDFGTLLGIVREGKIIGHDMDMDVGVNFESDDTIAQVRSILEGINCRLVTSNHVEQRGIYQDTFRKYGIEFDVYYYRNNNEIGELLLLYQNPLKNYKPNQWDVVRLTSKTVRSTILYDFRGSRVRIPSNYLEHIRNRYGENWRIPDKNYRYWDSYSSSKTDYRGIMEMHNANP